MRKKRKGNICEDVAFSTAILYCLTAGTGCAAACTATAHLQVGIDLKSDTFEINRYRLYLVKQILVRNKFKSVKFINFVHIVRFIQNQCQRRSASATLVKEKPDGLYLFFILEKLRNLLLRHLGYI